jgi:FkbH-like protein
MYETEVNNVQENPTELPQGIIQAFAEGARDIRSRTVLPWSEHCTECVWPTCYSTCELYVPRLDGRCRRFVDGMVRVDLPFPANSYLLKIRFKRWGKLWTPGSIRLRSSAHAQRLEKRDYRIGKTLLQFPVPSLIRIAAAQKRYSFKKRLARSAPIIKELPTCFLLECYNPTDRTVRMSLTMRATDERAKMPFQKLLDMEPGFHRFRIPVAEIATMLDVRREFDIELVPNDDAQEPTLYFGMMEFVVEGEPGTPVKKKVKCVVWDLDNTLWDGVLAEDGIEQLRLKPGIDAVIQALDARGVLNSIASKNNADEALEVIKRFKLDEYFLCPQISWDPKSQSIQAIAKQLNIGLDTLVFIDDSTFEREEVKAVCPEVWTLAAEEYGTILAREEFQVPVTEESKERRKLYSVEMDRQELAQSFSNDYMAFLRHCRIQVKVQRMTEGNLERVHELTQRTNQMNFSGNRYDRAVLRTVLTDRDLDTFVLSCEDRFGGYGVVGFGIVNRRQPVLTDLMFSCRIQSKRVEHAFLAYLIRRYIAETGRDFYANYRKTPRNAPSGQVFADLRMEEVEMSDGVLLLRFPKNREVLEDRVIEVVVPESVAAQPA